MKIKIFILSALLFMSADGIFSQKIPSLEINFGVSMPGSDMSGDFITVSDSGYYNISEDFVKNNYGNSTGISIAGNIVFPLDQKRLLNFIFSGEYTFMNAFKQSILGITRQNNVVVPATYDNSFSGTTVGLGFGTNPSLGKDFSVYANSQMTLNFLSMSFTKNDIFRTYFSDSFRMGVKAGGGMTYKLNEEYSLILGGSYHLSNLLFKNVSTGYSDRLESDVDNLSINDDEGFFYTNLSDPSKGFQEVEGKKKNIDFWNINIGISILLGKSKK